MQRLTRWKDAAIKTRYKTCPRNRICRFDEQTRSKRGKVPLAAECYCKSCIIISELH